MIKVILSDLARTFLFVTDPEWSDTLNKRYAQLEAKRQPYIFWDHFKLDHKYLKLMMLLKEKYRVSMFTSGYIQNHPELAQMLTPVFDPIFNEEKVGFKKIQAPAYLVIAQTLGVNPDEILFIDDDPRYIEAAQQAGVTTFQMTGLEDLKAFLKTLLTPTT